MKQLEANIQIVRDNNALVSVAVSMPIWTKESEFDGNLKVSMPLLNIETIAVDELDVEIAVKEAVQSFCIAAERFGEGLEKELHSLNWVSVDENGKQIMGFCVSDPDALLHRLIETGDFLNTNIELNQAPELEHA